MVFLTWEWVVFSAPVAPSRNTSRCGADSGASAAPPRPTRKRSQLPGAHEAKELRVPQTTHPSTTTGIALSRSHYWWPSLNWTKQTAFSILARNNILSLISMYLRFIFEKWKNIVFNDNLRWVKLCHKNEWKYSEECWEFLIHSWVYDVLIILMLRDHFGVVEIPYLVFVRSIGARLIKNIVGEIRKWFVGNCVSSL